MKPKPYLREVFLKREAVENFDDYPFQIPAICQLESLKFHEDITFLVGENGSGKSTLIEAIAVGLGFSPEGGTKNVQLETHQNTSNLHEYLGYVNNYKKPTDYYFLRAESFYNLATYVEEIDFQIGYDSYGGKSLHAQSHGEAFFATLSKKLRGSGLYIFDEPEAALSPQMQLSALAVMHKLVKKNSQFIIATHSPILLAYPNAKIYQLGENGIREITYEETESFIVTKDFLTNYRNSLRILLSEN
jgi:predicted ATPase